MKPQPDQATHTTNIKPIAEQLPEQDEFLSKILESLTHPFYVLNVDTYTVEIANSAAIFHHGSNQTTCYALTHHRDSPCSVIDHPCPIEEIRRTKKPARVEHLHYDTQGRERNVEVYGYPLLDNEGNVTRIIEYSLDITERRQAEKALRQSEARWRSVAQNSPDHIIIVNKELNIEFVNYASPGLTVESLIGTPLYTYVPAESQSRIKNILENAVRTGKSTQYETTYYTPEGEIVYYESRVAPRILDGQVTGLAINARDITEHKQTEQILREAKEAAEAARREERERLWEAVRRRQIAESLADIIAAINSNQPLAEVLDYIITQTRQLINCQAITIYQIQEDGKKTALQHAQNFLDDSIVNINRASIDKVVRQMTTTQQPIVVRDLACPTPRSPHQAPVTEWCRTLAAIPILVKHEIYGGLFLYASESEAFSNEDINLANALANQIALAVESDQLKAQIEQAAATAERNRLARDLHDSVTQALFSASLVAEVLPQVWQRDPDEALEGLEELRHLTRGALAEMRTLLLELRPTALLETRLHDLIQQLAEAVTGRTQLAITWEIQPVPKLPPEVHVTFYRVAQEALNNVGKHAEATRVVVNLRAKPPIPADPAEKWQGQLTMSISDNGHGFDRNTSSSDQLGLGIMRERAEAIGAQLNIETHPSQGTKVTLTWQSHTQGGNNV